MVWLLKWELRLKKPRAPGRVLRAAAKRGVLPGRQEAHVGTPLSTGSKCRAGRVSHPTSRPCLFLQAQEALGVAVPKARSPVDSTGGRPGRWQGKPGPEASGEVPTPTPHPCGETEVSGGRPPHASPTRLQPIALPAVVRHVSCCCDS